jgi:hypothetical protein
MQELGDLSDRAAAHEQAEDLELAVGEQLMLG